MKKRCCYVLTLAILLCSCSQAGVPQTPDFPKTQWDMNAEEVMAAWNVTPDEVQNYSSDGRSVSFSLTGCDVFGAQADLVSFSFINLALDESRDIQQFDEATMAGNEVLASVYVLYPEGTDTEQLVSELKEQYGETLPELTLFPMFNSLGTGMPAEEVKASDTQLLWGSDTVESQLNSKDVSFFQNNWPIYLPDMATAQDWEHFSQSGRMVTVVCTLDENGPLVQFDAYNLAVYQELAAQLESQNTAG